MDFSTSTLWLLRDGKPGHENQVLGLAEALGRRGSFGVRSISLPHGESFLRRWSALRTAMRTLPPPDLVIGAGHAVHPFLVYAARRKRARSVVLMKPTIPEAFFDFCVIPEHDLGDRPAAGSRRIVTRGAVNRMRYDPGLKEKRGVFLIGGPSREYGWDSGSLLAALGEVTGAEGNLDWVLTTSRRTPREFLDNVGSSLPGVEVFDGAKTGPDWLPDRLARAEAAWVTRDSVSMIYEALTAGVRVGVLPMPLRGRPSKLTRGVETLVAEGFVTPWDRWRETRELAAPPELLAEADRCADQLLRRLGWE